MSQTSQLRLREQLEERLAHLLDPTAGPPPTGAAQTAQQAIIQAAQALDRPGWSAYLVGGTLRDLIAGPASRRAQPRDVDIVVAGAKRQDLEQVLLKFLTLDRLTRFGGLHLSLRLASGSRVLFDVWSLQDHWGFHSRQIPPRIQDFPSTTFLNIDSCAAQLTSPPGAPRAVFEHGFFEAIADRVLDIVYAPNPYPYICVARALIHAARLGFAIRRPLAEYILEHSAEGAAPLLDAQRSHYGGVICDARELDAWLQAIRSQYDSGKTAILIAASAARRNELWHDDPTALTA